MSSETISLACAATGAARLTLRTIREEDLESLRCWKNAARHSFFFQEIIEPPQQQEWFRKYLTRGEDFMFVASLDGRPFGCMGIRRLEDGWDAYNIILGDPEQGGRGWMGQAFAAMLRFALARSPQGVFLRVLKNNPAVGWYKKNGFSTVGDGGDFHLMRFGAGSPEDGGDVPGRLGPKEGP